MLQDGVQKASLLFTLPKAGLACLENLVHRSGEGDNKLYKVLLIEIPATLIPETLPESSLKNRWHTIENYSYCQVLGSKWLNEGKSAVLKVPSVIIKKEHNYLVNPNHPDFNMIELTVIKILILIKGFD